MGTTLPRSSRRPDGRSPYKFLDSYTFEDREFFYGRERETQTLVTDVISSRIVVLFARTGTGKTSLINAGARPRLEELDYATFHIRVEKDPIESVRRALRAKRLLPASLDGRPLPEQLRAATDRIQKPIVVFYDQFEEFFIYFGGSEEEKVPRFINHVAELYRDREAAVHTVFSMREEYFVEMDAFRDEIPSIFHNDSSVRLRPFDPQQAARAIGEPVRTLGVEIDEGLAERVAGDLAEAGRIEPIRLQIVCDTLWREGEGTRLRLADYERLGRAPQIVARRLEEDIRQLDETQLRLFERLLPELRTQHGTKYLRGINELADRLDVDLRVLQTLLERLENGHLLKESTIHRAHYIEWTSDYLAERTDYLWARARAILYRRLLRTAVNEASAADDLSLGQFGWRGNEQANGGAISSEDFERLSHEVSELGELTREETAVAFGTALAHGVGERLWLEEALRRGVDVWGILQQLLRESASTRPSENAIQLLAELPDEPRAIGLLEASLDDQALAQSAFQALARTRSQAAIAVLERAVDDEAKAGQAIDALRRMETTPALEALARVMRREDPVGLRAGVALSTLASRLHAKAVATQTVVTQAAAKQVGDILQANTPMLFVASLRHSIQTRFWFDEASRWGVDVWEILRTSVADPNVPAPQAEGALGLLRELPDDHARELLELAAQQRRLTMEASSALDGRDKRERMRQETARQEALPLPATAGGMDGALWDVLLQRIAAGRCVPILGAGAAAGILPSGREIAEKWAVDYGYPLEDDNLAHVAQFLAVSRTDPMLPKEALAHELQEVRAPDFSRPDDPHGVLAKLPLPLYVTMNYDDLMLRALKWQQKEPRREICRWNDRLEYWAEPSELGTDRDFSPTADSPLVFHLYGNVSVPESMVVTEDDSIDFLVFTSTSRAFPHQVLRALASSSLLFIGSNIADWRFRVLYRGVMGTLARDQRRLSVAVQLPSVDQAASNYLASYLGTMDFRVYWGSAREFASELEQRWSAWVTDGRD
jgi:hypothetical protein